MKTILVTGASRGIGRSSSLHLLKEHHVIAVARSEEKLTQLAEESKNLAGKLTTVPADLTKEEDIQQLSDLVHSINGLDGLINNAGQVVMKPFTETSLEEWRSLMEINVYAPVHLLTKLKPFLKPKSHVVNIGSMAGFQGSKKYPGLSAYSATKGALSILTELLSVEFEPDEIAVNCLCLGAIQTDMLEEAFPGVQAPVSPDQIGAFIAHFTLTAHQLMNGKVLPVTLNNPR
ncbi:MAG: SDR family oxidoreductase [Bacteroidota bacterium]